MDDDIFAAECNSYKLAMFHVKGFVSKLVHSGYFNEEVAEPILKYIDDRVEYVESLNKD